MMNFMPRNGDGHADSAEFPGKRQRTNAGIALMLAAGGAASDQDACSSDESMDSTGNDRKMAPAPARQPKPGADIELALDQETEGPLSLGGSNILLPVSTIASLVRTMEASEGDVDGQYGVLETIRSEVLSAGGRAQIQVCNEPKLFSRITSLLLTLETHPKLVEGCCRVLCALVAKNAVTQSLLSGLPEVVQRLYDIVDSAASHAQAWCAACDSCAPLVPKATGFPVNCCQASATASAAMWALTALNMKNLPFQTQFCARRSVLDAVIAHVSSFNEESASASSWLICNAVMGAPHLAKVVMSTMNERGRLVRALVSAAGRGPVGAKGLVCWAIRALAVSNKEHQQAFVDGGALAALGSCLHGDATLQSSAVWCVSTLACGVPAIQDAVGADDGLMTSIVSLLESSSQQVQGQAASAIYNIAARHADNQTRFAQLGAVAKLINMLPKQQGSVKVVEKVIAALLCLALKHAANQQLVGRSKDLGLLAVKFLSCSSQRIQGLAAGLIRTVVAEQGDLQLLFASHGALSALLELAPSKDSFVQEQAVAALYNMVAQQPLNKSLLRALGPEQLLVALLTDCTKPTRLAYTCAIMVLYNLAEEDAAFTEKLKNMTSLVDALLLLCHPKCGDQRLRAQADRFLKTISPEAHAERPKLSPPAVLDALMTFSVPPAVSEDFMCPICMCGGESDAMLVRLPCGHQLHKACMHQYFSHGRDSCPCCRDNVVAAIHAAIGSDAVLEAAK